MSARVVVLRGLSAAPWDLRPFEALAPEYDVAVLRAPGNLYDASDVRVEQPQVRALSEMIPGRRLSQLGTKAAGERFMGLEAHLRGARIVHAAELGNWYTAQAARLKQKLGFRLVVTVWETLPLMGAYRNIRTRPYASAVLAAGDLFLATTERAREALLVEGAPASRVQVCPPGIDLESFARARTAEPPADGSHLLLCPARLVWEKGQQDILRAMALLARRGREDVRLLLVGDGPERARLARLAAELGLAERVQIRSSVPYGEMPALYAQASCMVLASMPTRYWEEQFGMVLAEAMAGHVPVVASTSGAIPEVLGTQGRYFAPGDWVGLAGVLESGPLALAPGARAEPEPGRLELYSTGAAAQRLREAYASLLDA